MNGEQLTQQMLAYQKLLVDNWRNSVDFVQTQSSHAAKQILNHAGWLPKEHRAAIGKWQDVLSQVTGQYGDLIHKEFRSYEMLLASPRKSSRAGGTALKKIESENKN